MATTIYASLTEIQTELGIGDGAEDAQLTVALQAASRQIDAHCGRRFWQDDNVVVRDFYADDPTCVQVDDISTTTGLIVKADTSGDGTYGTTLTINTHFLLLPRNADKNYPVQPWTEIVLTDQTTGYFPTYGRPGVQVTAKFGWPTVPEAVKKACLVQAVQLYKAASAPFGGVQLGQDGLIMRVRQELNPLAAGLLSGPPYCKPRCA